MSVEKHEGWGGEKPADVNLYLSPWNNVHIKPAPNELYYNNVGEIAVDLINSWDFLLPAASLKVTSIWWVQ